MHIECVFCAQDLTPDRAVLLASRDSHILDLLWIAASTSIMRYANMGLLIRDQQVYPKKCPGDQSRYYMRMYES